MVSRTKLSVVLAFALSAPFAAHASEDGLNPWTQCGIGAMIFSSTPWAAAISNVIWDLGTTAVTSAGTSENTCEGKEVAAARFIDETYASIEEETAKGKGQHLTAVLDMMGCESRAHGAIISNMRTDLGKSIADDNFAGKTHQEKAYNYYKILQTNVSGSYAKQCNVI